MGAQETEFVVIYFKGGKSLRLKDDEISEGLLHEYENSTKAD